MNSNQVAAFLAVSLFLNPVLINKMHWREFDLMFPNHQAWTNLTTTKVEWGGKLIDIWVISEITFSDIEITDSQLAYLESLESLESLNVLDVKSVERFQKHPRLVELARNHVRQRLKGGQIYVSGSDFPLTGLLNSLEEQKGKVFFLASTFRNEIGPGVDLECASIRPCELRPKLDAIIEACEKQGWTMTIEMQGIRITVNK